MPNGTGEITEVAALEVVFYVYTILIMLVCIAAGTIATSSYLITRNRTHLYIVLFFMFYFFDVALILQAEILTHGETIPLDVFYNIDDPFLKTLFAVGVLESLWLSVCDYLGKKSLALKITPAAIFIVASFFIVMLMEEGPVKQWCFYSLREAFLIWCLAYSYFQYRKTKSLAIRARLYRQRPLFAATIALVACIIFENAFLILIWKPSAELALSLLPLYLSERNFSENALVLVFAFFTLRTGIETLRLRAKEPPTSGAPTFEQHIDDLLPAYCELHNLTAREREILRLTLSGKDYQNVASTLQLAIGTVKSHTHNILKKTGQPNRQELMQDFWKE